jgi:hypothetical protein
MARAKNKSSRSARDKRAAHARASRAARRQAAQRAEADRVYDQLFSDETPPEQSAAALIERFGDGPVPAGMAGLMLVLGSDERARGVAEHVAALRPGSLAALTLAADVARLVDEDDEGASALLDQALEHADGYD